jgi:photosystem II stability/assembly factor-like uncharacterized protein
MSKRPAASHPKQDIVVSHLEERFTVLRRCFACLSLILGMFVIARAQEPETPPADPLAAVGQGGLRLRSIGPAVTSGRVVGFAVHPTDRAQYYVAAASGGVWKTVNAGTTWTPVFDDQGSYSIGYVTLDPKDPHTVWVGAGENNSQRSVGYGDGVYRSDDGGKTWKNLGLKQSEHIGKILIDPRDSNVVYVAAQGPLWGPGGDRGLYKTTDGGKTWKKVLEISENTGVTDVVLDPRRPDVLLAASYQRRRHVWTLVNGGPESALYKSTDGGATWRKLRTGLPTEEMGRIGLAVAPSDPDTVYAIIESVEKKGGIFRTTDFGETWERRNEFDQQAQYYAHLVVDPVNRDRIFAMNVFILVSDDGGKSLRTLGERFKHVDSHCLWIDPKNPSYYLVGCDGGIYESHDRAASWRFVANLPITQFYDVAVDEAEPYYHVYGGTQDNFTLGGPARTKSDSGITNADWFVTLGGDGFHCKVDPKDPNTVYCEYQYGGLARFDRRTGERVGIQPQPGKGEPPLRWNWDSPLMISPHAHTRAYFAANRVFRSDDRGDTWRAISGDLTRQLDRDKLPVMGKLWNTDAVAKHVSTSFYGNIVALAESPKKEGLLFAGTDDGLIQVTDNDGKEWRKIDQFPGVPDRTYVSRLLASLHQPETVYASFDNHKNADFAPYLLKSTDAGKTWTSIAGDLPRNGPVMAIAEDHEKPDLLFVGTEFGLYFTLDGGKKWVRLKGGMPTVAVRDLAIQRRENDLVLGTFGRGFYVLDDYTPLRRLGPETFSKECVIFPTKKALLYIPSRPYGMTGRGFQGAAFYTAPNPPFGATITYYLKEEIKTKKQARREAEKEAARKKADAPYPTREQLRVEAEEEAPAILITITDASGTVIRTLTGPAGKGVHRVSWDLREPAATLPRVRPPEPEEELFAEPPGGPLVMPGMYQVSVARRVGGVLTPLAGPEKFEVVVEGTGAPATASLKELAEFQQKVARLQRAVAGALDAANATAGRLEQIKRALDHTPSAENKWKDQARELEKRNREILRALRGDETLRARNENTPESIVERVQRIVGNERFSLAKPPQTDKDSYQTASQEFSEELKKLRTLIEDDLRKLERALDEAGAPWTPGRLPEWKDR